MSLTKAVGSYHAETRVNYVIADALRSSTCRPLSVAGNTRTWCHSTTVRLVTADPPKSSNGRKGKYGQELIRGAQHHDNRNVTLDTDSAGSLSVVQNWLVSRLNFILWDIRLYYRALYVCNANESTTDLNAHHRSSSPKLRFNLPDTKRYLALHRPLTQHVVTNAIRHTRHIPGSRHLLAPETRLRSCQEGRQPSLLLPPGVKKIFDRYQSEFLLHSC